MTSPFKDAYHAFRNLPGIGHRSAERLAFHLLAHKNDTESLCLALKRLAQETRPCTICGLISEQTPCRICTSSKRDDNVICVVKNVHDAFRIERSGGFLGLYHVLGALLSPFEEVDEQDLHIDKLLERVRGRSFELFLAFEESIEGEATAGLIKETLRHEKNITFTRLAVGIPIGAGLEHVDSRTLRLSLAKRSPLKVTAASIATEGQDYAN